MKLSKRKSKINNVQQRFNENVKEVRDKRKQNFSTTASRFFDSSKNNEREDFDSIRFTTRKMIYDAKNDTKKFEKVTSKRKFLKHSIGSDQIHPSYIKNEYRSVISKYGHSTKMGFSPNDPLKVNQDAWIISPNLVTIENDGQFEKQ